MELMAAVQPLVLTLEGYSNLFGEDDPEELALMQLEDKQQAQTIADVLRELYFVDLDLTVPRDDEGLAEEFGTADDLWELRRIAAESKGHTTEEYQEGEVPPGFLFNHLINHADDSGYYLPVEFPQAFVLEETSLGSSVELLKELDELAPVLTARFPAEMAAARDAADDPDLDRPVLAGPVGVWLSLRRLCKSSIALNMPIHLG